MKKVFLKISQNSQENTVARVSFLIKVQAVPATLLKDTLAQAFSCEFCEISKNTCFTENVRATASVFFSNSSISGEVHFLSFSLFPIFSLYTLFLEAATRATL